MEHVRTALECSIEDFPVRSPQYKCVHRRGFSLGAPLIIDFIPGNLEELLESLIEFVLELGMEIRRTSVEYEKGR